MNQKLLKKSFVFIFSLTSLIPLTGAAQAQETEQKEDDLFDELDAITTKENTDVIATFKSTRLLLGQSTERVRNEQLHFRISHVFSKIKGIDNFFGLDNLNNMHISFEYGLTDYIQLGLSRSNKPDKTYSTSAKLSLIRQKTKDGLPFSLSYFGNIDYKSRRYVPEERNNNFIGRIDYIHQVLISRKFNNKLSLQISPTYVHRNLTDTKDDPNNIYSLGIGGRYMVTRSTSLNLEYFYTIPTFDTHTINNDALTIGFDIETGGHVFQLYFTNAFALHPGKFALNQNGNFFDRDINFGFSILREFNL